MDMGKELNDIAAQVRTITSLHPSLDALVSRYRKKIAQLEGDLPSDTASLSGEYWRFVALCDSLVKMRIFIERNLVHIESLGLLALTRYIFELSVWISLLEQSASFGLVYRVKQLENNQKFYSDLKNHLLLEAKCFKQIDSEKNSQIEKLARNAANSPEPEELAAAIHSIEDAIDNRMALSFSIYGDEAKKNGYGFQAHLIEQKAITHAETKLAAIERELQEYRNTWADTLKEIYPPNSKGEGRWKWKEQARRTNMLDEFNFIYSYTSRLLHAEPIGLTTDEKSLTYKEIILFARYISSKINECMGKATQLINASTLH